jgi:hypothetical protein
MQNEVGIIMLMACSFSTFFLALCWSAGLRDFARNWILIPIRLEDWQIVCQLRGKMTNAMPTYICVSLAASQSTWLFVMVDK